MTATKEEPGTTPDTEEQPLPDWIPAPEPEPEPAKSKTEPGRNDEPGFPLGHWVLAGASAATLGGAALFAAAGPIGLAAGACAAAGGVGLYGYHRYRKNRPGRPQRERRQKTTITKTRGGSKLGSLGRGRGGSKLGGGRGKAGLGKGSGSKLGKGGKLGSGGKGGPKLGGAGKKGAGLGGGKKSGGLLGGKGKPGGKGLGGKLASKAKTAKARRAASAAQYRAAKAAAGKGSAPKPTMRSRLGSAGKSSGRLLGKSTRAGWKVGKGGGKLIGRGGKATARKAGSVAAKTPLGKRAAKGFKAAKKALKSGGSEGGRWSRFQQARQAARAKLGGKNWFTRFAAAATAAGVAGWAMARTRWSPKAKQATDTANENTKKPTGEKPPTDPKEPGPPPGLTPEERKRLEALLAFKEEHLRDMIGAYERLAADPRVHLSDSDIAEHMASRKRLEGEIAELRRKLGLPPAGPVIAGTVFDSKYEDPNATAPNGGAANPNPTMRSHMTSQFPLAAAAQQVTAAAAAYRPQTMWEVDHDLEEAAAVPLAIAEAFKIYTMTLRNNYPLHPAVSEALGRAYIALGEVATSMQQVPSLFKTVHADDIRRKTAPRGDESKWNVS